MPGERRWLEVAGVFLKLGLTSFGGPAAHTAMMRVEVVRRRRWLSDEAFLDLVGATNLLPGPNSTVMAIHLGRLRAGWPGFVVGGLAFILPAVVIVLGLSALYVRVGATPQAGWLLFGVKPVVIAQRILERIALLAQALVNLSRKAIRRGLSLAVGFAALVLDVDAIAIGRVTPGPLFPSATFIGYLQVGTPRALPSTVGMFLPAFALVDIADPSSRASRPHPGSGPSWTGWWRRPWA